MASWRNDKLFKWFIDQMKNLKNDI